VPISVVIGTRETVTPCLHGVVTASVSATLPTPIPALQTSPRSATLPVVARRRDRQRREARRAREHHAVHAADPEPFDREQAISHWRQKLATMTARGSTGCIFSDGGLR
jgi:hypothetical protein